MATDYTPIDCAVHDHLEVHAMRGDVLRVEYRTPSGEARTLESARLVTLRSRGGEEIGVFRDESGAETLIRLDRLHAVEDHRTGRRIGLPGSGVTGGSGAEPAPAEVP